MSKRDSVPFEILNKVLRGVRDQKDVAALLGICDRTLCRKAERIGLSGWNHIIHGNSGKRPVNRRSDMERERILALLKKQYSDLNITHGREKLETEHEILITCGSLRELMMKVGPLKKQWCLALRVFLQVDIRATQKRQSEHMNPKRLAALIPALKFHTKYYYGVHASVQGKWLRNLPTYSAQIASNEILSSQRPNMTPSRLL